MAFCGSCGSQILEGEPVLPVLWRAHHIQAPASIPTVTTRRTNRPTAMAKIVP